MERRLRSIPLETEPEHVTLRLMTGENSDDRHIDRALKRKFGSAVYYIATSNFYGIDDSSQVGEQLSLDTPDLGFFAYYVGVRDVCIQRRSASHSHLAVIAAAEERQLACFKPVDMSDTKDIMLRNYPTSVAGALDSVGVDINERISIKTVHDILSQSHSRDGYDSYVKLRSV